jgi:hypothetical protein
MTSYVNKTIRPTGVLTLPKFLHTIMLFTVTLRIDSIQRFRISKG